MSITAKQLKTKQDGIRIKTFSALFALRVEGKA